MPCVDHIDLPLHDVKALAGALRVLRPDWLVETSYYDSEIGVAAKFALPDGGWRRHAVVWSPGRETLPTPEALAATLEAAFDEFYAGHRQPLNG